MTTCFTPSLASFRNVFVVSIALRVGLILYSEWHDAHSVVKYTDVDYRVFTDAAAFVLHPGEGNIAEGPLNFALGQTLSIGSPYTRETYRYTPLLALLLTPNIWFHPSFGKYLFAACDILCGFLIYRLVRTGVVPPASRVSGAKSTPDGIERKALVYTACHLFNPLVFSISTRGSSESVLSLFVLITLYAALKGRWDTAAVFLGLSTHWKIYPVIYSVSLLGVIGDQSLKYRPRTLAEYLQTLFNWRTIRFGAISAGTCIILSAACYAIWGYPFLYESYLYHLHRLDHRHNFSPYFYLTYLTYPSFGSAPSNHLPFWMKVLQSPLTSFVPQMGLALGLGLLFGRRREDLVFTWFVQTVAFVVFNKVCTSQYFLWYLLLLPLLLPRLSPSRNQGIAWLVVWVGTQVLWLSEAYKLEFLGENVFFGLWIRSLLYVIGNCWVLVDIIKTYRPVVNSGKVRIS